MDVLSWGPLSPQQALPTLLAAFSPPSLCRAEAAKGDGRLHNLPQLAVEAEEQPAGMRRSSGAKGYHHKQVPRSLNLQEEYRTPGGPPTTLMVRNVPNRFTKEDLIVELEGLGFAGAFDFLYLPMDQGRRHRHHGPKAALSNVGYAFVNFIEPSQAESCIAALQNHVFWGSSKVAAVSVAHIQGLEANLAHYKHAAVNTPKLKERGPVIMANLSSAIAPSVGQPEAQPLADAGEEVYEPALQWEQAATTSMLWHWAAAAHGWAAPGQGGWEAGLDPLGIWAPTDLDGLDLGELAGCMKRGEAGASCRELAKSKPMGGHVASMGGA